MTMDAIRQHATRLSITEIERALVQSSGLATTCLMINAATLAELHVRWMDVLLDEWMVRQRVKRDSDGPAYSPISPCGSS